MSKIISREFRESDIMPIDEIYNRQPSLGVPSLKNMIINSTLEDEITGKIVGYGVVKIFAEAVLILDKEIPKQDRAVALTEAMQTCLLFCKDAGVEVLYAVASDENFAKVLEKSYLFHRVPGTLLCKEVTGNKVEDI